MPGSWTARRVFDLSLQGPASATVETVIPFGGAIREVWVGTTSIPTAGTLAITKADTNMLAAANADLAALTPGVGMSLPLTTANAARRVAAGDVIKATWTITTAGSFVGGACLMLIESDLI